jgi:Pretoxin HINT domain
MVSNIRRWQLVCCLAAIALPASAQEKNANPLAFLTNGRTLESAYLERPLVFENDLRIHAITVQSAIGANKALLIVDTNARTFDLFGEETGRGKALTQRIEATLKLVRADDPKKQDRKVYELDSPKFGGRLFIVLPGGRLIYRSKDGKVESVVGLQETRIPLEPCHPGCFPAGTLVVTPDGPRKIETLKAGDRLLTLDGSGNSKPVKIASVFVGQSMLIEVETEKGKLITTHKQPLNLQGGGVKAAMDLKAGDELLRYDNGKVQALKVKAVHLTNKPATIYNLVLEERATFLANGYLVKSKPPVEK